MNRVVYDSVDAAPTSKLFGEEAAQEEAKGAPAEGGDLDDA